MKTAFSLLMIVGLGAAMHRPPIALSAREKTSKVDCPALMKAAGMSEHFGEFASHIIHSITVEHLRKFDPSVGLSNGIPTIDMNLNSPVAITKHAPSRPIQLGRFHSEGMQILHSVLAHMDDANWMLRNETMLERIVHEFHMQELFTQTLEFYKTLDTSLLDAATCACASDDENNGVLKALNKRSTAIRALDGSFYLMVFQGDLLGGPPTHPEWYVRAVATGAKAAKVNKAMTVIDRDAALGQPAYLRSQAVWEDFNGAIDRSSKFRHTFFTDAATYLFCKLHHD